MTTEEMFDDLKQFIDARFSQQDVLYDQQLKTELGALETRLTKKIDDVDKKVYEVDLKLDTISEALHENLADHEQRITKLEQSAA